VWLLPLLVQLMRVYDALLCFFGKVFKTPEV